ncbi:unnamed protein product [Didymodactylos carnosus]|uniref:Pentapeptide repeat-containing protein n=1 Tax=Didymodactylos carnosus TaxID=1234261 RepID=A0A815F8T7_9BILA|nr:unnamed protein product [Didymodactylos carnosus]CAF1325856.1 unnamed protein product [Didymodactylos carnosus]CAF3711521.1 unnamed protein product [Didymodactylos carnosus]CAF4175476.1 unnamed protein product [Didymodactylos carnosus]
MQESRKDCHAWLTLLATALVPLMIGIFTVVITIQHQSSADRQRQQEQQQADNLQNERTFSTYVDDISKLLLTKEVTTDNKALLYIRTKTLSSLRKLDTQRRKYLLLFLYESQLLQYDKTKKHDRSTLNLAGADLNHIHIEKPKNFNNLSLPGVELNNASFTNCHLQHSRFADSIMNDIRFTNSFLLGTRFSRCSLERADFRNTTLTHVSFRSAILRHADFTRAWTKAADFTNADLYGALMTEKHLQEAELLDNARLPNGSFAMIQEKNLVVNGENIGCDKKLLSSWTMESVIIKTFQHYRSSPNCSFGIANLSSLNPTSIEQQVVVANYSVLIDSGKAKYNVSGSFGGNAYAKITFHTHAAVKTGKQVMIGLDERQNKTGTMIFQQKLGTIPVDTRQFVLVVYFMKIPEGRHNFAVFNNIRITALHLEHSHQMSINNLRFYPAHRCFSNEVIEQIKHYDKYKVPQHIIRNILIDTHQDKFYIVKNIGNILKVTSNNTITQELAVQTCLTEMKEADLTAKIEVIVQRNYELNMIFIACTKTKNNFQRYG